MLPSLFARRFNLLCCYSSRFCTILSHSRRRVCVCSSEHVKQQQQWIDDVDGRRHWIKLELTFLFKGILAVRFAVEWEREMNTLESRRGILDILLKRNVMRHNNNNIKWNSIRMRCTSWEWVFDFFVKKELKAPRRELNNRISTPIYSVFMWNSIFTPIKQRRI